MTAHSSGTGSSWNETLDVDQPHGLDFQEWNDVRIGVRKRMSQEHTAFADSTAGGIHKPGGVAVLGIEITDDATATVVADGTYRARGLVWALSDTSNWGALFCTTDAAGASTTGDWTIMRIHPDVQWGGGDITWTGAHEFDASVDISGNTTIEGDLTIKGALRLDGSADFSDVFVEGDLSLKGTLKADGTLAQFGGTAGIGLFYDPTVEAANSDATTTTTIGNGLVVTLGQATATLNATTVTAHGLTKCYKVFVVDRTTSASDFFVIKVTAIDDTNFTVRETSGTNRLFDWIAIGR